MSPFVDAYIVPSTVSSVDAYMSVITSFSTRLCLYVLGNKPFAIATIASALSYMCVCMYLCVCSCMCSIANHF